MENEILKELEKLQGNLNNVRAHLQDVIDLQMSLLENQIARLHNKIEAEQDKMGLTLEALEGKK